MSTTKIDNRVILLAGFLALLVLIAKPVWPFTLPPGRFQSAFLVLLDSDLHADLDQMDSFR